MDLPLGGDSPGGGDEKWRGRTLSARTAGGTVQVRQEQQEQEHRGTGVDLGRRSSRSLRMGVVLRAQTGDWMHLVSDAPDGHEGVSD
jgi:hypothetical protein